MTEGFASLAEYAHAVYEATIHGKYDLRLIRRPVWQARHITVGDGSQIIWPWFTRLETALDICHAYLDVMPCSYTVIEPYHDGAIGVTYPEKPEG